MWKRMETPHDNCRLVLYPASTSKISIFAMDEWKGCSTQDGPKIPLVEKLAIKGSAVWSAIQHRWIRQKHINGFWLHLFLYLLFLWHMHSPFCFHQHFLMSKDSTRKDQIKGTLTADHEERLGKISIPPPPHLPPPLKKKTFSCAFSF